MCGSLRKMREGLILFQEQWRTMDGLNQGFDEIKFILLKTSCQVACDTVVTKTEPIPEDRLYPSLWGFQRSRERQILKERLLSVCVCVCVDSGRILRC